MQIENILSGEALHLTEAPIDAVADASKAIAIYAKEVLRRAQHWAWWHAGRAEKRELPAGADALFSAAETLDILQIAVESRGISDSLYWAARKAYFAAYNIAAARAELGYCHDAAHHQECEVEESPMRQLIGALFDIGDRHWQMCEGFMTPDEAKFAAANDLIGAPFPPSDDEEESSQ